MAHLGLLEDESFVRCTSKVRSDRRTLAYDALILAVESKVPFRERGSVVCELGSTSRRLVRSCENGDPGSEGFDPRTGHGCDRPASVAKGGRITVPRKRIPRFFAGTCQQRTLRLSRPSIYPHRTVAVYQRAFSDRPFGLRRTYRNNPRSDGFHVETHASESLDTTGLIERDSIVGFDISGWIHTGRFLDILPRVVAVDG